MLSLRSFFWLWGDAEASLSGTALQSAIGVVSESGTATNSPSGLSVISASGTLSLSGQAGFSLTGQSSTIALGSLSPAGNASRILTGQPTTSSTGSPSESGNGAYSPTGLQINSGTAPITAQGSGLDANASLSGLSLQSGFGNILAGQENAPYAFPISRKARKSKTKAVSRKVEIGEVHARAEIEGQGVLVYASPLIARGENKKKLKRLPGVKAKTGAVFVTADCSFELSGIAAKTAKRTLRAVGQSVQILPYQLELFSQSQLFISADSCVCIAGAQSQASTEKLVTSAAVNLQVKSHSIKGAVSSLTISCEGTADISGTASKSSSGAVSCGAFASAQISGRKRHAAIGKVCVTASSSLEISGIESSVGHRHLAAKACASAALLPQSATGACGDIRTKGVLNITDDELVLILMAA